jgi:hypothetical protein
MSQLENGILPLVRGTADLVAIALPGLCAALEVLIAVRVIKIVVRVLRGTAAVATSSCTNGNDTRHGTPSNLRPVGD